MRLFFLFVAVFFTISATAQQKNQKAAKYWSDSVYQSLTPRERIAQLVVARLSTYDAKNKVSKSFFDEVLQLVKQYNIGGVCLFQGGPVYQARQLNELKANAKTPILCSIDAEWGLGMRLLDSVMPLPKQMMMGAMGDSSIVYEYGKIVANQCKRMGIQMNYAPVVDVNNNPDNPVINDRSFGEDKKKVAAFGIQYMKGMQDHGVMACAKHFPGHGDVNVDSHLDLPQINKSIPMLEQTELYPFRQIFSAGIGSVMIGHLYIPSIDNRTNRPTSLSANNVKGLLRDSMKYNGLAITDGLEMQGVKKFFSRGQSSVEAIRAGNDLLCIPDSIPMVIEAIENAILKNILSEKDIEFHCKRVLMAKFEYVADQNNPVVLTDLTKDLNHEVAMMRKKVAENAITLLSKNDYAFFPFRKEENKESIAFVGIGLESANTFSDAIQNNLGAKVFFIPASMKSRDSLDRILDEIVHNHCRVIVGIHNMSRNVAANFGLTAEQVRFTNLLQQRSRSIIFQFGNAYGIKNWCHAKNLVVCYEDDPITQETAYRMLIGEIPYKGSLPVSVCEQYKFGAGFFLSGPSR